MHEFAIIGYLKKNGMRNSFDSLCIARDAKAKRLNHKNTQLCTKSENIPRTTNKFSDRTVILAKMSVKSILLWLDTKLQSTRFIISCGTVLNRLCNPQTYI